MDQEDNAEEDASVTEEVYALDSDGDDEDKEHTKYFTYDGRGNLTKMSSGGKDFTRYEFDATNRLIEVVTQIESPYNKCQSIKNYHCPFFLIENLDTL